MSATAGLLLARFLEGSDDPQILPRLRAGAAQWMACNATSFSSAH
jgi:hypothetical protein